MVAKAKVLSTTVPSPSPCTEEVVLAYEAVEWATRQLKSGLRGLSNLHDGITLDITLQVLIARRGKIHNPIGFARKVALRDLRRRVLRKSRCCSFDEISELTVTQSRLGGPSSVASEDARIPELLKHLPLENQVILRALYLDPVRRRTQAQVADELGVTRQTVARRRDTGLDLLRTMLEDFQ